MSIKSISYLKTGYFSKTVCDYVSENEVLKEFYGLPPKLENFEKQIEEKSLSVRALQLNSGQAPSRTILVNSLKKQYQKMETSQATQKNTNALLQETTFTITTGHQLNLFTGPLYFLYKIFSVINLSQKLNNQYPENHFVPTYWLATEDHDFDEINYFNLFGKKIEWKKEASGAVGELDLDGLESVFEEFSSQIGNSENAQKLKTLFSEAYLKNSNLTEATRFLANALFSEYGLVIIDGNDALLKKQFAPFAEKDLLENQSFKTITETTKKLVKAGYKEQVYPREINLFYLKKNLRERIIFENGMFKINNTDIQFSEKQILEELQQYPERFSPNALLRPLYQEVILPNLCYVGGGGELAYWFQLKDYFESVGVVFPMLLLRNSVLLVSEKQIKKLKNLEVDISQLFLKQDELVKQYTQQLSKIKIDFSKQKAHLQEQFKDLYVLANQTDKSFVGAVKAQERKQIKGLENLEKRLLKAEKRVFVDKLKRITEIQDHLFPNGSLQERSQNFGEFYAEFGEEFFSLLKDELEPLDDYFTVLEN